MLSVKVTLNYEKHGDKMTHSERSAARQTWLYFQDGWQFLICRREWVREIPSNWTIALLSLIIVPISLLIQLGTLSDITFSEQISDMQQQAMMTQLFWGSIIVFIIGNIVFFALVYGLSAFFKKQENFPAWLILFNVFNFWMMLLSIAFSLFSDLFLPDLAQATEAADQFIYVMRFVIPVIALIGFGLFCSWTYIALRDAMKLTQGQAVLFILLFVIILIAAVIVARQLFAV